MRNSTFVPWLAQLLLGLAIFVGSLYVGTTFWSNAWEVGAAAAVAGALGLSIIIRAELKERPRRVLRKARKALTFPTQWAVKFNKRVPQGGIIPVAVIRSDGVRFVIDIQGHKACDWNDRGFGEPLLVGPRGKKFKTDPVGPLMQAATAWNATAVLWLPEATTPQNLREEGYNLIVVMGTARELKHALQGAEIVPPRIDPPKAASPMPVPPDARRPASGASRQLTA